MRIVLETKHLLFRDHKPEDMEPYCDMEADPEVRRMSAGTHVAQPGTATLPRNHLPPCRTTGTLGNRL